MRSLAATHAFACGGVRERHHEGGYCDVGRRSQVQGIAGRILVAQRLFWTSQMRARGMRQGQTEKLLDAFEHGLEGVFACEPKMSRLCLLLAA